MFAQVGKRYINIDRVQEITWYGTGAECTAHVYFNSNSEDMLAIHGVEAEALVAYIGQGTMDVAAWHQSQQAAGEAAAQARYSNGRVGMVPQGPTAEDVWQAAQDSYRRISDFLVVRGRLEGVWDIHNVIDQEAQRLPGNPNLATRTVSSDEFSALLTAAVADGTALPEDTR